MFSWGLSSGECAGSRARVTFAGSGAELGTSHGDLVTEEIADAEVEEHGASVLSAGAPSD